MTRAYRRNDRPFPVSARAMAYLAQMDGITAAWWQVKAAPRIYERLRRSGYVTLSGCGEYAQITNAGRALLARTTAE